MTKTYLQDVRTKKLLEIKDIKSLQIFRVLDQFDLVAEGPNEEQISFFSGSKKEVGEFLTILQNQTGSLPAGITQKEVANEHV